VDESAEEVPSLDCPGYRGRWAVACFWWLEPERSVWSLAVVVRRVGAQRLFEVAAADDE